MIGTFETVEFNCLDQKSTNFLQTQNKNTLFIVRLFLLLNPNIHDVGYFSIKLCHIYNVFLI
jgi:hypothetical protein